MIYLTRRKNEVYEGDEQKCVVVASNCTKRTAERWAQYIVDRENSVRHSQAIREERGPAASARASNVPRRD